MTDQKKYSYVVHSQENYTVTKKKFKGKDCLVIPMVMMVEGVHNGSLGPLFHSIDELGKFPASWDGIPIVINHPEKDGLNVSANSPEILELVSVGQVFNTHVDGMKLKAEAWIDEMALKDCSLDLYNKVKGGELVEVSVGVFTDNEEESGKWNGEEYYAVATNHRPDHLALLTDVCGACSLEDGCGLGANQNNKDMNINIAEKFSGEDLRTVILKMNEEGFSVSQLEVYGTKNYTEIISLISQAVRAMDTNDKYHYVEEVTSKDFIYNQSGNGVSKYYKQSYVFEGGKIKLMGVPIEVRRKVEYVVNSNVKPKKEVNAMSKTNECPKCLEKVNALIANKDSKFTEEHREWLLTQEEAILDLLAPTVVEVEKEKIVTVEKTVEVNKLAPEDQAALAFGKKQLKERREGMIKTILDNTENVWTEERLKAMDDDILEGISKSVRKEEVGDYSLAGGNAINLNADGVEPLYPAGFEVEPDKK